MSDLHAHLRERTSPLISAPPPDAPGSYVELHKQYTVRVQILQERLDLAETQRAETVERCNQLAREQIEALDELKRLRALVEDPQRLEHALQQRIATDDAWTAAALRKLVQR